MIRHAIIQYFQLFSDPERLALLGEVLEETIRKNFPGCTKLVGLESRGFLMGMAVASRLGVGFVPIRKKGKLPGQVVRQEYTLEYGTDIVEIEKCSLTASDKVVLIDDLIATGGTMKAAVKLIGSTDSSLLGALCLIEIDFLKGKEGIDNFVSLIHV
jgi:adenine phosphoribosyltransferase